MLNKKLLRIIVVVLVVGFAGYGAWSLAKVQLARLGIELLGGEGETQNGVSGPSFTKDTDSDGLSDAKEEIYGTEPQEPDADGDGKTDGDEVRAGEDPTLKGQAKISDNPILWQNLTVQYFEWARETTQVQDPQLDERAINVFLTSKKYGLLVMPTIDDNELILIPDEGPEVNSSYLDALASVKPPPISGNYLEVANDTLRTNTDPIVDAIVQGLDDTISQVRQIQTPKEALTVQKGQLALLKVLKSLFLDLKTTRTDPVKLTRNIGWGNQLIVEGGKVEKARQALAAKGTIIRPEPTPTPTAPPTSP